MLLTLPLTLLLLAGCSTKQAVPQIIVVGPQAALLSDCKVEPIGLLGEDYRTVFYAVSRAYIATAKNTGICNTRLKAARQQLEQQGKQNDSAQAGTK